LKKLLRYFAIQRMKSSILEGTFLNRNIVIH
jgi:hypothetical protein